MTKMTSDKSKFNLFISYYHVDRYFKDKLNDIIGDHYNTTSSPHKYEICHNHQKYTEELQKTPSENNIFIVLVGNETYKSKNVDWEINYGLHEHACMLGLCLPTNDDYLKTNINPKLIPEKLANNVFSGYASYFDWTENVNDLENYIDFSLKNMFKKHALLV